MNDNRQKSFWEFSIYVYRKNGVADTFLRLQNDHGVDVNMLLYCCWHGITRGVFTNQLFQTVFDYSTSWCNQTVKPLRNVRTWLKQSGCHLSHIDTASCMEFREEIKGIELQAEKIQQTTLESYCKNTSTIDLSPVFQLEAIVNNLKQYFAAADITYHNIPHKYLEIVADASIENLTPEIISEIITSKN